MLLLEGWTDGRRGGEKAEVGGSGVSGRVELRAHQEIFISPCPSAAASRLPVVFRAGPVPGGMLRGETGELGRAGSGRIPVCEK